MKRLSYRSFTGMFLVMASAIVLIGGGPVALAREAESGGSGNSGSGSTSTHTEGTSTDTTTPSSTDDNPSASDATEGSGKNRVRPADNSGSNSGKDDLQAELKNEREKSSGRLSEARKNVCEQRSTNVRESAGKINSALQAYYDKFTQIYQRVDEFKSNQNLTVANYDSLLAAVKSKQQAASVAIEAAKVVPEVNCGGDNPKGQADTTHATFAAGRNALKDYRAAIKALIAAVKAAVPHTEDSTNPQSSNDSQTQSQGVN